MTYHPAHLIPATEGRTGDRPYWDRGDGFDQRDPSAPAAWLCGGCDGFRETVRAYCPCCEAVTDSYRMSAGQAAFQAKWAAIAAEEKVS